MPTEARTPLSAVFAMPLGCRNLILHPPSGTLEKHTVKKNFDYSKICEFENLYKAYLTSRKSKRSTKEVIAFEMDAGPNLSRLQNELKTETYHFGGYYHFTVHDPKIREIYALHYRDRIVQHCICDNLLGPYFEKHLIFDNAACRKGKGTLFAMNRLNSFLHDHFRKYGKKGWFLKCDIRKFFDHIDHRILKGRLEQIIDDPRTLKLLFYIIDSYEVTPGKGIPMGNQTSQWFALFYLDPVDRLVKEKLQIKHYTRYMDDFILVSHSKDKLQHALNRMKETLCDLGLEFNEKTQVFPICTGVEYLGWRFSLTETGAVARRIKKQSRLRWQHRLRKWNREYQAGQQSKEDIKNVLQSYQNHLSYGNTYRLYRTTMTSYQALVDERQFVVLY